MKAKDGEVKHLLRQIAAPLLPKEVAERKKSPYPKNYHPEYEQMLCKEMKKLIAQGNHPILVSLNPVRSWSSAMRQKITASLGSVNLWQDRNCSPTICRSTSGLQGISGFLSITFIILKQTNPIRSIFPDGIFSIAVPAGSAFPAVPPRSSPAAIWSLPPWRTASWHNHPVRKAQNIYFSCT